MRLCILLISSSKSGLQRQLNTVQKYGIENEIKYNPEKIVYMLFNSQNRVKNISEAANQLELDGQHVKKVSQFKY